MRCNTQNDILQALPWPQQSNNEARLGRKWCPKPRYHWVMVACWTCPWIWTTHTRWKIMNLLMTRGQCWSYCTKTWEICWRLKPRPQNLTRASDFVASQGSKLFACLFFFSWWRKYTALIDLVSYEEFRWLWTFYTVAATEAPLLGHQKFKVAKFGFKISSKLQP